MSLRVTVTMRYEYGEHTAATAAREMAELIRPMLGENHRYFAYRDTDRLPPPVVEWDAVGTVKATVHLTGSRKGVPHLIQWVLSEIAAAAIGNDDHRDVALLTDLGGMQVDAQWVTP